MEEKKENPEIEIIEIDPEVETAVGEEKEVVEKNLEESEKREKEASTKKEEVVLETIKEDAKVIQSAGLTNEADSIKQKEVESGERVESKQMELNPVDNTRKDIKVETQSLVEVNESIVETIDLESETETVNGEQEELEVNCIEQQKEHQESETNDAQQESDISEIIDLNQDPEIIYVEEDSLEPSEEISKSRQTTSPVSCNIPVEHTPKIEDPKLLTVSESVDLTTPSPTPGSSPVHSVNDDDSSQKFLSKGISETEVRSKLHAVESVELPSTSVEDILESCKEQTVTPDSGQEDMSEGEKLFEINCVPISTETTQSPKAFSEHIIIENSEDMSMPSEGPLLNSSSPQPSPYREEQSKSTENSSEPAHLDEKFLSNVDVLSCLGICQENANNTSFNVVDTDDVLRRNNNKEMVTAEPPVTTMMTTSTPGEEHPVEPSRNSNKLKRCANSSGSIDIEAPPLKKARCDMEDLATQNAIPDSLSSESETSTTLMVQSVPVECSTNAVIKDSSHMIESETSCDEKFLTLIELKTFEAGNDVTGNTAKSDETSIDLKRMFASDKPDDAAKSLQEDANVHLSKNLETKIDVVQETQDSLRSARARQNVLLINEESGSDGMLVDECTTDPLCGFTNPVVDDKKNQEVDSGVDISSSVKSESVPEVPVKRPRGRPRKDGRPAGSVKKPEKKVRGENAGIPVRRKFKGVLLEAQNVTEVVVTPRKRGPRPKLAQNLTHNSIMQGLTPQGFTPGSIEKTDIATLLTPVRPLRGRGSRGGRISRSGGRGRGRGRGRTPATVPRNRPRGIGGLTHMPEKDGNFFSPERRKTDDSKTPKTSSLQVFEEDTRMSAESISTPARQSEVVNNEDTQSSMQSSTSALEGSSTTVKKRAKMEVVAPEGKTEYTVDMIAEYDWPPPKGCCPAKNRDTFMIQEQIAQYLGIKSFKRKYPDLPRRQIDMEERNYLREKGLVTEKMCDLGITAVWASDVLDIMYSDFYDKYEEYKNYLRQKQLRDIEAKQKALAAEAVDKGLQARERALQSAAKWNSNFNKARKEDRRLCLDLQSLVIQIPSAVGKKMSRPSVTQQPPSHYPIALVPGQFSERYRTYTPQELRCYPINTVLEDYELLNDRLRPNIEQDESSGSESGSSDSSSSGSESESSSGDSDSDTSSLSDEDEPPDGQLKCFVCHQPQNKNQHGMPEVFIRCVTCRRRTHPSCIEMPRRMVTRVRNYNWQCVECKCCIKCKRKQEENKMLFCEQCDRGYHIYCLQIKNIPEGRWHCERCAKCMRCGSRKPEGNLPPPTPSPVSQEEKKKSNKKKAKWVHEYKIDHLTKIREHFSILCGPCARLKANRPKS